MPATPPPIMRLSVSTAGATPPVLLTFREAKVSVRRAGPSGLYHRSGHHHRAVRADATAEHCVGDDSFANTNRQVSFWSAYQQPDQRQPTAAGKW
ncbi:MAG: hypothetical protein R2864_06560 [Syntrophotaleaceae bacterium]